MKTINSFLLLLIVSLTISTNAQVCTADPNLVVTDSTRVTFSTPSPTVISTTTGGIMNVSQTITVYAPKKGRQTAGGTLYNIDSIEILNSFISSNPSGAFTINNGNNFYVKAGTKECFTISATIPNVSATPSYTITISSAAHVMGTWSSGYATPPLIYTLDICQFSSSLLFTTNEKCGTKGTATVAIPPCSSGPVSYLWSNGETTATATNLSAGTYTCTISDAFSTVKKTATIAYDKPASPICLITVDNFSTYNTLMWSKSGIPATDSFCVYREATTNNFVKIATVPPDSLSEYNDITANPNVTNYTYVITTKDICGNESAFSNSHSTIHLQNNGNGNFAWTLYQIENTTNPVDYYVVYRDTLGNGNFAPISSTIPGTNSTFTDVDYSKYPNAKYYISVSWSIACTPTRSLSTTRSNIKSGMITGIEEYNNSTPVTIFPNPTNGIVNIKGEFKTATLYNSLGELILITKEKAINIIELSNGVYFIEVNNKFYKIIKN